MAILFEHQSTPAARMPLRLLGYMVRGYEKQLHEEGRKRPAPIIPVVLYHGQRRWTAPRGFASWLGVPDAARELLKNYIPDFSYLLETRQAPDPEHYKGPDTVRFVRLLLDHAREPRFFTYLQAWRPVLLRIDQQAADEAEGSFIGILVRYVYHLRGGAHEPLLAVLEETRANRLKGMAMNTYQQTLQKGRREGLSEGLQLGRTQAARELLVRICARRFGPLPARLQARVDAADLDSLGLWAERAAVSAALEDVFDAVQH